VIQSSGIANESCEKPPRITAVTPNTPAIPTNLVQRSSGLFRLDSSKYNAIPKRLRKYKTSKMNPKIPVSARTLTKRFLGFGKMLVEGLSSLAISALPASAQSGMFSKTQKPLAPSPTPLNGRSIAALDCGSKVSKATVPGRLF